MLLQGIVGSDDPRADVWIHHEAVLRLRGASERGWSLRGFLGMSISPEAKMARAIWWLGRNMRDWHRAAQKLSSCD